MDLSLQGFLSLLEFSNFVLCSAVSVSAREAVRNTQTMDPVATQALGFSRVSPTYLQSPLYRVWSATDFGPALGMGVPNHKKICNRIPYAGGRPPL